MTRVRQFFTAFPIKETVCACIRVAKTRSLPGEAFLCCPTPITPDGGNFSDGKSYDTHTVFLRNVYVYTFKLGIGGRRTFW